MIQIETEYFDFLTDEGKAIFDFIVEHLKQNDIYKTADVFEIAVLANSFDMYRRSAKIVNEKGATQKPERGGWDQVSPHYTVLKNEYQLISKHAQKFMLNPEARQRVFKGKLTPKKKVSPLDNLD